MSEGRKRINEASSHWGIPALYLQGTEPFIFPTLSGMEAKAERLWQKIDQIDDADCRRKTLTAISVALQPGHAAARKVLQRLNDEAATAHHYAVAETHYREQHWREAYRALEQVERLVPNFHDTRSLLAEVLGKLGDGPVMIEHPSQIPQYEPI